MRFIISTHTGLEGARLSRPGHFTNLPYPSPTEAEQAATRMAGRVPASIEHERFRAPSRVQHD